MALFKKIDCAECGKQTNVVFRLKLNDGEFICSDCAMHLPGLLQKTLATKYSLADYRAAKEYVKYSNETLRSRFSETSRYYSIHIDEINGIFYLGRNISNETIFFQFENISNFDLVFEAEKFKEGFLNDKVMGEVLFELEMAVPKFSYEEKLATNVKAPAQKKLFGTKIVYGNPPEMEDFLLAIRLCWYDALEALGAELESDAYVDTSSGVAAAPSELNKAMSLFMLDSMDDVTLDELKVHRNRLIKVFHPDTGSEMDTKYAQKINKAYDILKNHVNS